MSASITTQSAAPAASTDEALVSAYSRGEEPAASELVRRHMAALGQFLYSSGADRDEVEDLVQETLFRAFRRLDSWQGHGSFRGWLLTIGSNLLRDQFRRRKGRQIVSLDQREIPDRADPHADSPPVTPRSACGRVSRLFPGYSGRSSCCGRSKGPSTTRSRRRWEPLPVRLGSTTITR